ncbi:SIMPL domain-containing protein [Teichococcus wenyumeiae]|nr:SIMPL domain-containing protein [Pseudoroseomonas wenyumeiae]
MPRRLTLVALLALSAAGPLAAQPVPAQPAAPASARAETTLLRLSETGEVTRAPDELRLNLRAEARGRDAATVQAQVNRMVQAALAKAGGVAEVRATTGGYWTNRDGESREWTASQGLSLRATQATPALELAGTLQGDGLLMDGMAWSLSPEAARAARQEAGRLAIEALRARAAAVAEQLGMEVAGIRSLSVDTPEAPMPRMAMAMRAQSAAAAPPPASAPEEVTVTATAQAEVLLRPRS